MQAGSFAKLASSDGSKSIPFASADSQADIDEASAAGVNLSTVQKVPSHVIIVGAVLGAVIVNGVGELPRISVFPLSTVKVIEVVVSSVVSPKV